MRLPRDGREWAHWTITADGPITGVQVQIGGTWHPTLWDGTTCRILVQGPDADPHPDAVTITRTCHPRLRVVDAPEVIIRAGGWILLESP